MTWVPWQQEYGICKHWAVKPEACHKGSQCKWQHPRREQLKTIWDFWQQKEAGRAALPPPPPPPQSVPVAGDRTGEAESRKDSASLPADQPTVVVTSSSPVPSVTVSLWAPASMGAVKRLSNGEPKPIGPHPSTIRVSAAYMSQKAIDAHLAPRHIVLDATERGHAEAREDQLRLQGVTWLDNVRRALQLPIRTLTTACVYYHKFRLAHPTLEYNCADATAAALLVACKVEDTLKKSRDILAAAYNLKLAPHDQLGADDAVFEGPSRVVIGVERMVLEAAGFDFRSRHPHELLVKIAKSLPQNDESRNVAKLGFTVMTDLHRTFAPLKQTSATLGLASLELAARLTAATSPIGTCAVRDDLQALDIGRWSTTREEVMETLLDALDLCTHHTTSSILGTMFSVEDFLRIRLALNKECAESNLPRYTTAPEPSPDRPALNANTLRVANGHPTPVSPADVLANAAQQAPQTGPDAGTQRFNLDLRLACDEQAEVQKYYAEEWEEYEEEIEVPLSRPRSGEPRDGSTHRSTAAAHTDRSRDLSRSDRAATTVEPAGRASVEDRRPDRDGQRERDRLREKEKEVERERARLRERDRERERERDRRYEDRRYDERDRFERRDRRYDERERHERRDRR